MTPPENIPYIAYLSVNGSNGSRSTMMLSDPLNQQEQILLRYKNQHKNDCLQTYTDIAPKKPTKFEWPQLQQAVEHALNTQAHLLIVTLKNLTVHPTFALILESFAQKASTHQRLICLDQPSINKENIAAAIEHAQAMHAHHSQLIKEGIERSSANVGNPHAAELLKEVNQPRIENSIVYALLMLPILQAYQNEGLSQRKMVERLNEEGFSAPEGGTWQLSQFQKMLHRVKLCHAALLHEKKLSEFRSQSMNTQAIAQAFNDLNIMPPKGSEWDTDAIESMETQLEHIHHILNLNELYIALLPLTEDQNTSNLDPKALSKQLEAHGIVLPQNWQTQNKEGPTLR